MALGLAAMATLTDPVQQQLRAFTRTGGTAIGTVQSFATAAAGTNTTGGDVLNLRDLLQGEQAGLPGSAGNLANCIHFKINGGNTIIHVSPTGGFRADSHSVSGAFTSSAETQTIILSGVNLQSLYSGASTTRRSSASCSPTTNS